MKDLFKLIFSILWKIIVVVIALWVLRAVFAWWGWYFGAYHDFVITFLGLGFPTLLYVLLGRH